MRKTGIIYLLKSIRKNGISFFATAFIVSTCIALYVGMQSSTFSILEQTDRYFHQNQLESFEIKATNGLSEEEIEMIASWEEVDFVEGGYSDIAMTHLETEKIALQTLSLSENLNLPVVIEGELPNSFDEVAIEEKFANERGIKIGDCLILEHKGNLVTDTFQVTAIINQPNFNYSMGKETRGVSGVGLGVTSYYIALPIESFESNYYFGRFTTARIKCDVLDEWTFYSDEYKEKEVELIETFETYVKQEEKDWFVLGRHDIGDVRATTMLVEIIDNISYPMSIIFLLLSVVICWAATARMIDEQRNLIGMQKSLGFSENQILNHYMWYGILCAFLGILVGGIIGVIAIESTVVSIFQQKMSIGEIKCVIAWNELFLSALLCLLIFPITSYVTCKRIVKETAVSLLRGIFPQKEKHYFFEHWNCYERLHVYSKVIIKNVLNDKSRIVMTIAGVVGSITLLVMCFSLKFAVENAYGVQVGTYYLFDYRLVMEENSKEVNDILQEMDISYQTVQDRLNSVRFNGATWENAHIVVVDDVNELKDYMILEAVSNGEQLDNIGEGFLVSRKCAEVYELDKGSTVEIMSATGTLQEVKIAGIVESYLPYHQFVAQKDYYESVMGENVDFNIYLLNDVTEDSISINQLMGQVKDLDGFLSLKDNMDLKENTDVVYAVIGILSALSAAMAFLVLLNQMAMYINRKSIELAVMRINGFTLRETRAYLYRDNIVLTLIGMIVGSGVGAYGAYFMTISMEKGVSHYVRTPNIVACLIGCAIGAGFALISNMIALRKVKHLNLVAVNSN